VAKEALTRARKDIAAWAETAKHFAGSKTPLGDLERDLGYIDAALEQIGE